MIRSMFSAISGLRAHRTMLDVVGNNISNVNTSGFKNSAVVFQDILSQTVQGAGAGAPTADIGGTNPSQIGLGVNVARVNTNFSQGALQRTNRDMDFALRGDGFFTVQAAGEQLYTRGGSFSLDSQGRSGDRHRRHACRAGRADAARQHRHQCQPIGTIAVPVGDLIPPTADHRRRPATATCPTGDAVGTASTPPRVEVFDTQGQPVLASVTFDEDRDQRVGPCHRRPTAPARQPPSRITDDT